MIVWHIAWFWLALAISLVALATPMHADGSLDMEAFRRLVEFHVGSGTEGIVVAGVAIEDDPGSGGWGSRARHDRQHRARRATMAG